MKFRINLRATFIAVFVFVLGLAAVIVVGVEKDLPYFRDFLRRSTPTSAITGARIDSLIEIDAHLATTHFELDLEQPASSSTSSPSILSKPSASDRYESLLIELPPESVVRDAGIRVAQAEFRGSARVSRGTNDASDQPGALVLDSVRWSLVGNDHLLIEFEPMAPQFVIWLNISSLLMPRDQSFEGSLRLPRLVGGKPENAGAFKVVAEGQVAPDFSATRTSEQQAAGQSRNVKYSRNLTQTELYTGIEFPMTFDKAVNLIWTSVAVSKEQAPELEPVLVVRFAENLAKTTLNVAKVLPSDFAATEASAAHSTQVESRINAMAQGAAVVVGKDLRPAGLCDEAAALVEAWQWAAAQVDSMVLWVPGSGLPSCDPSDLSRILAPLASDLSRAGGKPKIAVITEYSPSTSLIKFAPWIGGVAALERASPRRYRAEFATFERGSLPAGPEVVAAGDILKILWEFSVVNTAANGGAGSGFLTVSTPLAIARP